jgi:RNA polymerase sigma factor for flagellar operon FliA
MRERLTKAINGLRERERLVLTLFYYEKTTMKEIGLILGVLPSRVSQIHASAVLHLRARLAAATTEQPRGDENHPNRASRKSFRKRGDAGKHKSSGYAEAIGCR